MLVFERRASTVLYNFLIALRTEQPFLLPANICPIVPLVFLKTRTSFELIDIDLESLAIDETRVLELLSLKGRGVAGVLIARPYGASLDVRSFVTKVKTINPEAIVIDDRCLSPPEFTEPVDSTVDLVLYSTGYAKVVDLGCGGYGFLKRGLPYEKTKLPYAAADLTQLTNQYKAAINERHKFEYHDMDWLENGHPEQEFEQYQARVWGELALALERKQSLNTIYLSRIPSEFQLPSAYQTWRFNIRLPHRDEALRRLFAQGLFASAHYASLGGIFDATRAPNAEALSKEILNLFNDRYFDVERAMQTCDVLDQYWAKP